MTESPQPKATSTIKPAVRNAMIVGVIGAAAVVVLGIDVWQQSKNNDDVEAAAVTETTTATPAPTTTTTAAAPEPTTCGEARVVTVEGDTTVRWELVRESDAATTACSRVTLYRDTDAVSDFELPGGVTFIDGNDGLWTYRDGGDAVAGDQSVDDAELSGVWLIASATDGSSVSANLADGQLGPG